jgi:hypothetical protein
MESQKLSHSFCTRPGSSVLPKTPAKIALKKFQFCINLDMSIAYSSATMTPATTIKAVMLPTLLAVAAPSKAEGTAL